MDTPPEFSVNTSANEVHSSCFFLNILCLGVPSATHFLMSLKNCLCGFCIVINIRVVGVEGLEPVRSLAALPSELQSRRETFFPSQPHVHNISFKIW